MTWKTHLIGGAQVGILIAYLNDGSMAESVLITGTAMLGSVLPDMDHPKSKISKSDSLIGLISFIMTKITGLTKHRGFLHTVPGALSISLIFYLLGSYKTDKESLLSLLMAIAVFLVMHITGSSLRILAGWFALGAYIFGPEILSLVSGSGLQITASESSAALCAIGVFAGCMMHIAYDAFNSGGVMLLYPFSKKTFRLTAIKTNTAGEIMFAGTQILLLAIVIGVCCGNLEVYRAVRQVIEELAAMAR